MCHSSCLTCIDPNLFTSCASCVTGKTFYNGACFCNDGWSSLCTSQTIVKMPFQFLQTLFACFFVFAMILYCLKIKLPFTYRIISGMQSFSLLLYSNIIYLEYEDFYGLRLLGRSNGFYYILNRLDSLGFEYTISAILMFGSFLLCYFVLYYPVKILSPLGASNCKKYCQYLQNNAFPFLFNFYIFFSRYMYFFIGKWIVDFMSSGLIVISSIVVMSFFSLVILVVLVKTIYDFHQNTTDETIYQAQIYLFCVLGPSSCIGLGLATSTTYYYVIYAAPLALLFLIIILNRNYQIFTKPKVLFYIVEVVLAAVPIIFVLVSDSIKSYVLLAVIPLACLGITIQSSIVYYSGIQMEKGSIEQVYPEESGNEKGKNKKNSGRAKKESSAKYF